MQRDGCVLEERDTQRHELPPEDLIAVNRIRDEKYATWDWNYSRSQANKTRLPDCCGNSFWLFNRQRPAEGGGRKAAPFCRLNCTAVVHHQHLAGDGRGLVRGEEQDRLCLVLRRHLRHAGIHMPRADRGKFPVEGGELLRGV